MELKIYDKQGIVKMTVSPDNSSQWNHEVGVENVVTVNFTTWEFLVLEVGWYILIEGHRFSIKSEYRPKHIHNSKYTYNLKFYGREHDTQDILFCRLNQGEDDLESVFAYDGTPMEFLNKVVANMNRNSDGVVWKAGEAITANRQTINFNGLYCWDALGEIARTFGSEWWMDGEYVNLSKCIRGESVSLGYGEGLKSGLTQNENTNAVKWFTRLIPVGSSKNIDKSTYGYANLQLPGREKYIDINTQYGLKEYREEAAFSEIYPHRVGTISSVRSEERTNEETGNYTVYFVKDSSLPFNPDDYMIGGEVIHMSFNSGALSGKEFDVNWNNDTKEFEIINQYPDENTQLPGNYLIPAIGDAYVLSNISMPDEYNTAAEKEYKEAVDAYLAEYSKDVSIYSGNTDYIYVTKNNVPLLLGQRVRLISEQYFDEGSRESRITRVSRKLNNLGEASIDCSDAIASSWKTSVDSSLNQLQFAAINKEVQSLIQILKTGDSNLPSDYNVFSALRSLNTFLRKDKDDGTPYKLNVGDLFTAEKDARLCGTTEMDDAIVNEAIHSKEFISGFLGGKGWAIQEKEYTNSAGIVEHRSVAEFDDVIVRGVLRVFEFVVSQLLGENDNRVFTAMLKVDHYDPETGKVWLDTQDGTFYNPFRKDDIILVQQFNGLPSEENNFYITKQYELIIDEVGVGDLALKEERLDWVTFRNFASPMEGATVDLITKGDTFVRIDNLTDPTRKGIIQMMTVGEETPYMDVIYGRKTDPDNALKSRFGNLQGVYNHMFGWLRDFGAYIANLYAVGEFRIAHTGEDVADKIEMVRGAFRTHFSQSYFEMKDESNYLKNGTFGGELEGWEMGESSTQFMTVDGIAIYANRNLMTGNDTFAGRAAYNDKDMLRIFNSDVKQLNADIRKFGTHKEYVPMDGGEEEPSYEYVDIPDTAYLTMRLFCDGDGTVEVGFDNGDTEEGALPFVELDVVKRPEEYIIVAEGVWNGKGDFVIRCTGDIYVEYVTLTDRPLDNMKVTTETWIEQDAGRIALLGKKIDDVSGAVTDLGIELDATNEQLRLYVDKTDENTASISQLRIDVDSIDSVVVGVQGDAEEAKELAEKAEELAVTATMTGMYSGEEYEQTANPWKSWAYGTEYKHVGAVWYNPDTEEWKRYVGVDNSDSWESINEPEKNYSSASYVFQNKNKWSAIAANFDANGVPVDTSGFVTTANFAGLFSESLDAETDLVKRAEISVFITENEVNEKITNIKLTADNVDINGIVQVEGSNTVTIGGFRVTETSLSNEDLENDASIIFRNGTYDTYAAIGGNVLNPATGVRAVAMFENHNSKDYLVGVNYAMIISAQGASENEAIHLNGGSISCLALKTKVIGLNEITQSTAPTSLSVSLDRGVGSVYVSTQFFWRSSTAGSFTSRTRDVHLTLPAMEPYDDGHVIKIKRGPNNGNTVYVKPGTSYRMVRNDYTGEFERVQGTSYIWYNQSSYAFPSPGLAVEREGDAMELVYYRDLSVTDNGTTYHGCWVQFKHPRDW